MKLPAHGDVFLGRYDVLGLLGRGGFASVYRAEDRSSGRDVAIKILDPGDSGYPPEMEARFLREVQVLAKLRDPHTITMFDFGRTKDGLLFMVFEFIPGRDLEEILAAGHRFGPEQAIHVLRQVLKSLQEAHLRGLLHRDVKPANIRIYEYMGDPLRTKLLDFGIARATDPGSSRITRIGGIIGTPQFMAPEQIVVSELTPATDIYSLGLVAYEMITGQIAVDGQTSGEILDKQLSAESLRIPTSLGVPPALAAVVERMVRKLPDERYQEAVQVLEALDSAEASLRPPPPPTGPTPASTSASFPTTARTTEPMELSRGATVQGEAAELKRRTKLMTLSAIALIVAFGVVVALLITAREDPAVPRHDVPSVPYTSAPIDSAASVRAPAAENEHAERRDEPVPTEEEVEAATIAAASHVHTAAGLASRGGCPEFSGVTGRSLHIHPRAPGRSWLTYVPTSYDGTTRTPAIVLFHDSRDIAPEEFLAETEFERIAERDGVVIVVPRSLTPHLAAHRFGMAWRFGSEPSFIKDVIESTLENYCIDSTRVFAVGHASGAAFLEHSPANELPFRAIATTSFRNLDGTALEWEQTESPAVPRIQFAGREDQHSPIEGGHGCMDFLVGHHPTRLSLDAREDALRKTNGCSERERVWRKKANQYECHEWTNCAHAHVSCVHPFGHHWRSPRENLPDLVVARQCRAGRPMRFDVAGLIWDFFEEVAARESEK